MYDPNEQLVQEKLRTEYQWSTSQFGERQVLGTFLIKNTQTVAILFPTVEDIIVGNLPLNSWMVHPNSDTVHWADIRLVYERLSDFEDIFFTVDFRINPAYEQAFAKLKKRISQLRLDEWAIVKENGVLAQGLSELYNLYLSNNNTNQIELFDKLSENEKTALIYCFDTIGTKGDIVISQAVKATGLSRPVFTSLFKKLSLYKGAEVKSMGVKGTHITFYDFLIVNIDKLN